MESRIALHGAEAVSPFNGQSNVSTDTDLTVAFDFDADPATVDTSTFELRDPQGMLIPSTVSFNAATKTATLDPISPLPDVADYYMATLKGGPSGIRELGSNEPIEEDFVWHFITESPGYSDTVIFSGLTDPIALDFASDGRVFVAEKSGLIKVFDDLDDTSPDTFADLRTNVLNFWDRGLLGLTLHPDFPTTPYVYVLYTHDAAIGGTAPVWGNPGETSDPLPPGITEDGAVASGRLSRLEANGNVMTGSELVLVEDWGQQFPSHSVGSIEFGADGMLYASAGEGASFTFVDYGQAGGNPLGDPPGGVGGAMTPPTAEGGSLRAQDLRSPGDPVTLDGTLIRIDPNTGLAAPGNPLLSDSDPNAQRIVAYGMRNPFRFAIRPGTNEVWLGDVGSGDWEEIDVVRDPTDALVENFGWPAYEGPNRTFGFDTLNLDLLESLYNDPNPDAHIEPFYAYNHAESVVPGGPTGGASISAIAFSEGGNLPPAYDGALFFADFARNRVWVMFRDVNGEPNPASRSVVLPSAFTPVQLKIGPAGDLYYVDILGKTIRRVQFLGVEKPPDAVAQSDVKYGPSPLTVNFDATASSDPNPDAVLTYAWDLDGDGQLDDSTAAAPTFVYGTSGVFTVTLEVTDNTGRSDTDTLVIGVDNAPPTAVIDVPPGGSTWSVGDLISFSGHATDPDEGTLADTALDWQILLHHCTEAEGCHVHFLTDLSGAAGGSFNAPDHEYPSFLELRLTATDSTGFSDTAFLELQPNTVDLTFETSVPGLHISVNNSTKTTPFTNTVIVGSTNSITAASPQFLQQKSYVFDSWSDAGAQSHEVIAPVQPVTYTADFLLSGVFAADFSAAGGAPSLDGFTVDNTGGAVPGLWHLSTGRGADAGHSTDDSLYFGTGESAAGGGNFDVGFTAGRITSPIISLAGLTSAELAFNYFLQTENDATFDRATVAISQDGGAFATVLTNPSGLADPSGGFVEATADLAAYLGSDIRIRFDFNTQDAVFNAFEGWYVDDVVVRGEIDFTVGIAGAVDGRETGPQGGQFMVTQSAPTAADTVLAYSIGGTATAGSDYQPLSGTVTILAGTTSIAIPVPVLDDSDPEATETVSVTLTGITSSSPGVSIDAGASSAAINILDDDNPGPTEIFAADFSDAGGEASLDGFVVVNTGGGVPGLWHLSTGRGADAGHSADDSLYFGTGEGAGGGGNYAVGHTAGRITSPTINLAGLTSAELAFNYFLQTENDAAFDRATVAISQDGGAFATLLTNPSGLADPSGGFVAATVDLAAYLGSDVRIRFAFNSVDGVFNDFEGWYVDDVVVRGEVGSLPTTVSIAATADGNEAGPTAGSFTVTQSAITAADTVLAYSIGGTATAGSDYQPLGGTVTIVAGTTSIAIPVPVLDDSDPETTETVTITLTTITSSSAGVTINAGESSAAINVLDNDMPVDDGFETGLGGWQTSGDVTTAGAGFGETPPEGSQQAVLTNNNAQGGSVTDAAIESFLGLAAAALDGLSGANATAGSVLKKTISANVGDQLTFQYNFLTDESTPSAPYNDFAFFSVTGGATADLVKLADTNSGGFGTSASTYSESTGYQTFVYTFTTSGIFTIGFGVLDLVDTAFDTALLIDDFTLVVP